MPRRVYACSELVRIVKAEGLAVRAAAACLVAAVEAAHVVASPGLVVGLVTAAVPCWMERAAKAVELCCRGGALCQTASHQENQGSAEVPSCRQLEQRPREG